MKALFHINEPDRWPRVIMNIRNFLRDAGPANVNIEVVANGAGVTAYSRGEQGLIEQMKELNEHGVVFAACRNALHLHNIDEHSLPAFVYIVPAGITEIVEKQASGYAYIKP